MSCFAVEPPMVVVSEPENVLQGDDINGDNAKCGGTPFNREGPPFTGEDGGGEGGDLYNAVAFLDWTSVVVDI